MPMNNFDERLRKLILQLLQSPPGSSECDRGMEQLLALIPRLPRLRQDPHPDYLEAVNKTLLEVKQKFPDFQRFARKKRVNLTVDSAAQVRQCFVSWVNRFLKFDILDLYRQSQQHLSLDAQIDEEGNTFMDILSDKGFEPPTWDGLEDFIQRGEQEQIRCKAEALERYIETDPDGLQMGHVETPHPIDDSLASESLVGWWLHEALVLQKETVSETLSIFQAECYWRWSYSCPQLNVQFDPDWQGALSRSLDRGVIELSALLLKKPYQFQSVQWGVCCAQTALLQIFF